MFCTSTLVCNVPRYGGDGRHLGHDVDPARLLREKRVAVNVDLLGLHPCPLSDKEKPGWEEVG